MKSQKLKQKTLKVEKSGPKYTGGLLDLNYTAL
jgi:hypothetical protein